MIAPTGFPPGRLALACTLALMTAGALAQVKPLRPGETVITPPAPAEAPVQELTEGPAEEPANAPAEASAITGPLASYVAMLDLLPRIFAENTDRSPAIGFADFAAARQINASLPNPQPNPLRVAMRVAPLELGFTQAPQQMAAWPERVGYGAGDMEQVLYYSNRPARAALYRLEPAAAARVPDVLRANGYVDETVDGITALAVGEDNGIDLSEAARADPHRNDIGNGARIQFDGPVMRLAPTWPMVAILSDTQGGSASDEPNMAATIAAVSELAAEIEPGQLLQVTTYVDVPLSTLGDPFVAVNGAEAPGGPTTWRNVSMFDFAQGDQSVTAMALTLPWPGETPLEPLAELIAQRWQDGGFAERLAPVSVHAYQGAENVGVITLTGQVASDLDTLSDYNPLLNDMMQLIITFEVGFLP